MKQSKHDNNLKEIHIHPKEILGIDDIVIIALNARRISHGREIGEDDFLAYSIKHGWIIGEYKCNDNEDKALYQLDRNANHHEDVTGSYPKKIYVCGKYEVMDVR